MNTTHKDLNPLNKIAKNIKEINGVSPTPTPTGSNVHVYVLEFNYDDAEEYENGYYIEVDSNIKATILNDYQTYGQDHCYFAKIVLEGSSDDDFVMFVPISFYDLNSNPYPGVYYEFEDYTTCVYFDDDEVELEVRENESYEYTGVNIDNGALYVYTKDATYQDSDAVSYLYNHVINLYYTYTKLQFSNYDTNQNCMLTCSNASNDYYIFTGKVNNKPIALILTHNGDDYAWNFIGRTLDVRVYNGGLIYDSPSNPVTYNDFYEELHLCYANEIPFELELKMNKVTINNKVTNLIFNKWDYIHDGTNQRTHAVSTVIHPDGYVISVDILIQNTASQVMYNIITL